MSFNEIGQCVLLLLCGFSAFSCTVREDRSDCPCTLALDLRDVPAAVPEDAFPVRWRASQGAFSQTGLLSPADCETGFFHIVLPRGGAQVYAVTGDEGLFDDGMVIPSGHGCPPVRLWTATVDAAGETATAVVRLRKEHCRLTVRMTGAPSARPYRLILEGGIAGYDAAGYPVPGPFRCSAVTAGSSAQAVLPRQQDDSLLLHILDGDAADDAPPLRTFAIGHAIAASGYDWTAPDLADLTLDLDFAASTLSLSTDRWTRMLPFEITI